jgi:myo-inositol-1(or 4)-monophosphatase
VSQLAAEQLDVIERAQRVAGAALDELRPRLRAANGRVERQRKDDGTPVSSADHEVDERLGSAIAGAFPDHGVLSEERHTTTPDADWCWIVDPIDGTSNFIAGLPWWCVSVALAYRGEVVLGIVDAPALDARWTAVLGQGTRRDGEVMRVREPIDPRDAELRHVPLMLTTGTAPRARKAGLRLNPRVMGSYALDMVSVAEGVAAGSLAMVPHVWDIAASTLLVTEAGGATVTLQREPLLPLRPGQDYRDRTAIVAAGPTADWVREVLGPLPPR